MLGRLCGRFLLIAFVHYAAAKADSRALLAQACQEVCKAIQVLRQHHSASVLPGRAIVKLLGESYGQLLWAVWKFLGELHSDVPDANLAYQELYSHDGDAALAGKGKKGAGKDAQTDHQQEAQGKAPLLEALPPPPTATAIAAPKGAPASSSTTPSPEKQQLDAIFKILRSSRDSIPMEAQNLLDQFQQDQTQQEARSMHKAVSQQSAAKKEIEKIRAARSQYMQQWAQYIQGLADLLQRQVTEQETVLAAYDDKEAQWMGALTKATADLKQMTSTNPVHEISEDEQDMEAEDMVDRAIDEEQKITKQREEHLQQSKQLQVTLESIKAQAMSRVEEAKRDGSRTPRRQASHAAEGQEADKPDAAAAAVPGQAR
ncbi:unnamed protein product [Symbiodinium sp. KB8]|nr:unnamed protein product [Symbiodinium sp. KB8]